MIANEKLDQLSQALLNDPSVLSPQEHELLAQIVRRCAQHELAQTVVRVAGEVMAERVCRALGVRLAEHLAEQVVQRPYTIPRKSGLQGIIGPPKPPTPSPPFPGPPGTDKQKPCPPEKEPPKRAEKIESRCVVLEEFLAPAELNDLLAYALRRQPDFRISEVIAPGIHGGAIDFDYRRSRVLMDLGEFSAIMAERVRCCLPQTLDKLGHAPFLISQIEAQITASNHGDFFRWHSDNLHGPGSSRRITFVYFFHREPKAFKGGELRLYDSSWESGTYVPGSKYCSVAPRQNQIVFFDSSLTHEITLVECPSVHFEDSRFTVNGWLHE